MRVALRQLFQMGGFLLLISMLFLGLSVVSYSYDDPAWNYYLSQEKSEIHNLGGIVGALWADWIVQTLGSTGFILIAIGVILAWRFMLGRWLPIVSILWRGTLLLVVLSAGMHLIFANDPVFGADIVVGGVVGEWSADVLVYYLNGVGASLCLVALGIVALFVGADSHPICRVLQQGWTLLHRYVAYLAGVGQCLRRLADRLPIRKTSESILSMPNPVSLDLVDDSAYQAPLVSDLEPSDETPEVCGQLNDTVSDSFFHQLEAVDDIAPTPSLAQPLPPRKSLQRHAGDALPSLDLLDSASFKPSDQHPDELQKQAQFLERKLHDFGVEGEVVQVLPGPVITMYEFAPASGVKVNKIVNLQDDLALVMRALSVRVVAPIPGKAVVGIEIPNRKRQTIRLRELLDSDPFRNSPSKLSLALGQDILGVPVVTDLALIPHLLIAGSTGSGKSVGLNSMICSLLFRSTPADVRMIMIDPKMLELSIYDGIPHLLIPVVTNPKQAAIALRRVVQEMERRYQLLASTGVRSIAQYNQQIDNGEMQSTESMTSDAGSGEGILAAVERLPYLVVVIDELSDLMMVSSREVEDSLTRIAQMARASGIHLIVATQRPSVDVLTGVIKANFPARVSFQVSSKTDSRTILDANGAEKLLGQGDMLFLAPGTSKPQRIHGAYVSEAEINRLVKTWKNFESPCYDDNFLIPSEEAIAVEDESYDEKYDEAIALVTSTGQASISMLQRRLRVGYNRSARMIEIMEREGIIGPADGVRPREVLVRRDYEEV
ncbi:MAG: DNA translocase FtsK 4TM domain-containing protein [bacterium]|nr:DNA translocase FtsK 4TM domain-containing protein [bacterium]